jgi:hypothetical protein
MRIALAIVGFLVMPVVATAENLETTHLFGFTLGTDVNNVGQITGAWQHQSDFGISGALTLQVQPGILIGAEARYLRSFDGLGLDAFAGQAFFYRANLLCKIQRAYLDVGGLEPTGCRPCIE